VSFRWWCEERSVFDARWRSALERATGPAGSALCRIGLTADELTAFGLLAGAGAAVAIGSGRLGLGLGLLVVSAVPDLLDGALAKASGRASPRGAFFDSVADRVTDSLLLGGFAWYLARRHDAALVVLPLAVLAASFLVSYERARAEALGFRAHGGLMERGERIVGLGAALAFSSVMVPLLWTMLVLTAFTALQRFVMVWRQASVPSAGESSGLAAERAGAWRPGRVESRFRAWREAVVQRGERRRRPRTGGATLRFRARRSGAAAGRFRARRAAASTGPSRGGRRFASWGEASWRRRTPQR
jgi:CDP-diacylglycerol--glycerol-3-phosphate 3-phosphatidyltransferase